MKKNVLLKLPWARNPKGYALVRCRPAVCDADISATRQAPNFLNTLEAEAEYDAWRGRSGEILAFVIDETKDDGLLTDLANIPYARSPRGPSIVRNALNFLGRWGPPVGCQEIRQRELVSAIAEVQMLMELDSTSLKQSLQAVSLQPATQLAYCRAKLLALADEGRHMGRCKWCRCFFIAAPGGRGARRKLCGKPYCAKQHSEEKRARKVGLTLTST